MTYKIRPKRSNVASKVPLATDLEIGELAINMVDQKIYTKTPANAIVELGGGSGATIDLSAVDQDIVPDGDLTRSLGSPTHQWADLYVGNATIYLNNVPLGLDGNSQLTFNGNVIANSDGAVIVDWADITGKPALFSGSYNDLTSKPTLFTANQSLNTGNSVSFNRVAITGASGIEGGEIELAKAPSSTLDGNVIIDVYGNKLRFFEGGGSGRGFYLDLTTGGNNVNTNIMSGGASINTGNITFNGDNINSTNDVVNVSASNYAQLESNNTYVWVENNSATVQVNEMIWVFDNNGNLTLPDLGAETPSILYANGISILNGLGGGGNPFNQDLNTNDSVGFIQVRTDRLEQGWNNVTKTSGYTYIEPGQTTDIWTADNAEITSVKFTVQFETKTADPYYSNFDTQTCEIVLAKKRVNNAWTDAPIVVYAMVHTSEAPLATFSSYINGDGNAVLTCTPADGISARSYLRVQSMEMQSPSIQNDWC